MLVCPLCGKSSSLHYFDPSEHDLDIIVQEVHGLGRGKGFEVGSQTSVLGDDEITPIVVDRVLAIVKMLIDNDCLKIEELLSYLDIPYEDNDEEE